MTSRKRVALIPGLSTDYCMSPSHQAKGHISKYASLSVHEREGFVIPNHTNDPFSLTSFLRQWSVFFFLNKGRGISLTLFLPSSERNGLHLNSFGKNELFLPWIKSKFLVLPGIANDNSNNKKKKKAQKWTNSVSFSIILNYVIT